MKSINYLFVYLALFCGACEAAKTEKSKLPVNDLSLPTHTSFWTNRSGGLPQFGYGPHGNVFVLKSDKLTNEEIERLNFEVRKYLKKANLLQKDSIVTWRWQDGLMKEAAIYRTKTLLQSVSLNQNTLNFLHRDDGSWPWAIIGKEASSIIKTWQRPKDWILKTQRSSYDGRYHAMYFHDDTDYPKEIAHIAMLDTQTQKMCYIAHIKFRECVVKGLAVSRDGKFVAVLNLNGDIVMIDAQKSKVLWNKVKTDNRDVCECYGAFSADGKYLYAIGLCGRLNCIDVQTGTVIKQCWGSNLNDYHPRYRVFGCEISPDGRWLAHCFEGASGVLIWDLNNLDKKFRLINHKAAVYLMSFSPDSKRLAVMGGGKLNIWDIPLTNNKYTKTYDTQDPNNPTPEYTLNLKYDENTPKLIPEEISHSGQ